MTSLISGDVICQPELTLKTDISNITYLAYNFT